MVGGVGVEPTWPFQDLGVLSPLRLPVTPPAHKSDCGIRDLGLGISNCLKDLAVTTKSVIPDPESRSFLLASGGGARIRTGEWGFCRPLPCLLATPPRDYNHGTGDLGLGAGATLRSEQASQLPVPNPQSLVP